MNSLFLGLILSFLVHTCCHRVLAVPTNITVDDEVGDPLSGLVPTYIPAGGWKQGNGCGTCHAKPDRRRAFNETWHDATHFVGDADPRIIHIHFDGSAIYAYFILANQIETPTVTRTQVRFEIDDQFVGNFTHRPSNASTFEFNVPAYSNSSVPPGLHKLSIIADGPRDSLVLFDYAVYTRDLGNSSSDQASDTSTPPNEDHSSINIGVIVGGIIGGLLVIAGLIFAILYYRRRKNHPDEEPFIDEIQHNSLQVDPFTYIAHESVSAGPLTQGYPQSHHHIDSLPSAITPLVRTRKSPQNNTLPGVSSPPSMSEVQTSGHNSNTSIVNSQPTVTELQAEIAQLRVQFEARQNQNDDLPPAY